MTRLRHLRAIAATLALGGGAATISTSCEDSQVAAEKPSPSALWHLARRLQGLPNEPISSVDAGAFWGTLDADPQLVSAARETIGAAADTATLYPVGDGGRTFLVDGEAVALYARGWRMPALDGVGLVSYALHRNSETIYWTELAILPAAQIHGLDPFQGAYPDGKYAFLVRDEYGHVRSFDPESFTAAYLPEESTAGQASSALSTCDVVNKSHMVSFYDTYCNPPYKH